MAEEIYHGAEMQECELWFKSELQMVRENIVFGWWSENKKARTLDDAKNLLGELKNNPLYKDKINVSYANNLLDPEKFARYQEYIKAKKSFATTVMKEYDIPVAISLAQSMNESDAWTSLLATKYNNFHGLTCKSNHDHKQCFAKNDWLPWWKKIFNYFMNFNWKSDDASRNAYGDRLKNFKYTNSKEPVYAKCFESKTLREWCSNIWRIYAHAPTYAKSLFTLIVVFNLHQEWSMDLPLVKASASSNATKSDVIVKTKDIIKLKWTKLFDIISNYYSKDLKTHNEDYTNDVTVADICSYLRSNYPSNIREDWKSVTVIIPSDFTFEKVRNRRFNN